MKKLAAVFLFCIIFTVNSAVYAEQVEGREITLNLSFGTRTGRYTGEISDGLPHGQGRFDSKNAVGENWYYLGNFVEGHFEGDGTLVHEGAETLSGVFSDDKLNGHAQMYKDGQLIYDGEWQNGVISGYGSVYENNGKWTGLFKNGLLDGEAEYYVDGTFQGSGVFDEGELLKNSFYGKSGGLSEFTDNFSGISMFYIFIFFAIGVLLVILTVTAVRHKICNRGNSEMCMRSTGLPDTAPEPEAEDLHYGSRGSDSP